MNDYQTVIRTAKALACEIIRPAGELAKSSFDRVAQVQMKGEHGDLVTEVDTLAEELILPRIREVFPDHQIRSEEAGISGEAGDWLWMIDPLDGTNNFAIGLSIFAVSITLMYRREPVLGVVYEPMTDRLFVSVRGEGATCNGHRMAVKPVPNLVKGTVGWIQGHVVQRDVRATQLRHYIDGTYKRMLRLWAPTVLWCLLAKGDIQGIVLYNSEGDDLYSGLLMVREAGGVVIDFDGRPVIGMCEEPYLIACHPDHQEQLLETVRSGLRLS
ncbi:inositol monophosphatase family protein [Paenibacillus daejeonensis]|uniref:inositol monophosphatase family protein n=1 Tax=Paenibacillus daejeonensis TaxID=135193 RepID=UPI000371378E|nr:inositol monophosphatase [Paenibacillus daejeonensis]